MAQDPYTDGSGGWPIPLMTQDLAFKDVGSSGLRQFGGWVREEFLPQLQGRQAARVYREMLDNSPTVGALIFSIVQSMRKIDWRTEPASDKPEAQQAAVFCESLRHDMSHTWDDFVVEALSMLGYGFSVHEIVYKRRNGPKTGETPTSKYNDGKIGWRRLPVRGQDTILKWFFDENGAIKGVTQQPWIGTMIDLPIEKLLLFRPGQHKNNPEGRSILRNSYRPYYFIKRLEEQEAILFERLSGLPVVYVPNALLDAAGQGNAVAQQALEQYKKIVRNVRIDEQMGVILPSDTYPGANGPTAIKMYDFELKAPQGGRTNVNAHTSIERYKLDILMSTLADFVQVGHGQRGTQSLAISKVDMFFQAIEAWVNGVASVLNRHGLPRILALNGMDPDLAPQYIPDLAQRIDLDALGNYILHMAQAGMQIFPDEELENWIRDAAGMPDVNDAEMYNSANVQGMGPDALKKIILGSVAKRVKASRQRKP